MIAKKFVNISVTKIKKRSTNCEVCGTSLLSFMPDDRSVITCPTCGLEKFYVKDSAYVDTATGSVEVKTKKTKSEYYDITNFKKLVDAYQGKGGSSVNKEQIIKDLDNYFKKNGFPSCQEIKEMKADNLGRRGPFKISRLFEIFSEIGHVEYGENAWLIAHIALGWDLPDLSKYEAKIYSDYQKTQEALNNMTDKDRSSSIGRHYRLFKHMELAGYPCIYENDFKVCRMKDTIRANEELWKKMCESCGDESIYFIPTSYIS
jgi:ribosomal protein S27AE